MSLMLIWLNVGYMNTKLFLELLRNQTCYLFIDKLVQCKVFKLEFDNNNCYCSSFGLCVCFLTNF